MCVKVKVYSYNRIFNSKTNEQNLHKPMKISKTKLSKRVKQLKKIHEYDNMYIKIKNYAAFTWARKNLWVPKPEIINTGVSIEKEDD